MEGARLVPEQSDIAPFTQVVNVFLDRDGVINRKAPEGRYVFRWSDFHLVPGVEEAIARLNALGHKVIVVTNQRGVALGLYTAEDIAKLHDQLAAHLALFDAHIDAIYYCPHDKNKCDCRKPGTALFEEAFRDFPGASPANSVMIGDSISDIKAGIRLGMPTIFIKGDLELQKPRAERGASLADAVAETLLDAVNRYIAH